MVPLAVLHFVYPSTYFFSSLSAQSVVNGITEPSNIVRGRESARLQIPETVTAMFLDACEAHAEKGVEEQPAAS